MTQENKNSKKHSSNMQWHQAIVNVLSSSTEAMSSEEIASAIIERGLRKSVGATPPATVASYLSVSLRDSNSPFSRVARGLYTLKQSDDSAPVSSISGSILPEEEDAGALRAFGMYWQRDKVLWSGSKNLFGRQGGADRNVNFYNQIGVYLLHDRDRVVYVGRASESLLSRLKSHTNDRLSGRWDRFSWFGLRGVDGDGNLVDCDSLKWTPDVVVETMEALLIESLEPPLNRKRGDNFSAIEFIQVVDPLIEKEKKKALLDEIKKSANL